MVIERARPVGRLDDTVREHGLVPDPPLANALIKYLHGRRLASDRGRIPVERLERSLLGSIFDRQIPNLKEAHDGAFCWPVG